MKAMFMRFLKWIDWFVSLFRTKDVGYLGGLMFVLFVVDFLFVGDFKSAFLNLFSADRASESMFSMFLFFVVWLIGGGVLVTVMVGQYYKNKAGGFRRCTLLVGNHVVVLGWDDGILRELKQVVSEGNYDCYVVTNQNVPELERLLKSAGVKSCCIYKGDYDNPKEWRENLKTHKAVKVFIAGEREEDAHDARVRVLLNRVQKACQIKRTAPEIKVNIHDFGLAKKLMHSDKIYENFHLRWAKALWKRLAASDLGSGYQLFVVGFGAMGKAVVLEATELDGHRPASILVTDDDSEKSEKPDKLEAEKARFKAQFPHLVTESEAESIVRFAENWDYGLREIVKANGKNAVIVVAKKRSEKGLLCMMEIVSKMGDSVPANTRLVLNQEVDGYQWEDGKKEGDEEADFLQICPDVRILLFGMKRGCLDVQA